MYFSLIGRKELFTAGRVGSLLPQASMHRKQAVNLKKDKHRRLIQREKDNIDFFLQNNFVTKNGTYFIIFTNK